MADRRRPRGNSRNSGRPKPPWWKRATKFVGREVGKHAIQLSIAAIFTATAASLYFLRDRVEDYWVARKNISHEEALKIAHREVGSGVVEALPFRDRTHSGQAIAVWTVEDCESKDAEACDGAPVLHLLWGNNDIYSSIPSAIEGGAPAGGWAPGEIVDWNHDGHKEIFSKAYVYSADGNFEHQIYTLAAASPNAVRVLAQADFQQDYGNLSFAMTEAANSEVAAWLSAKMKADIRDKLSDGSRILFDWYELNGYDFHRGHFSYKPSRVSKDFEARTKPGCSKHFGDAVVIAHSGNIYIYNPQKSLAALLYKAREAEFLSSVSFNGRGLTFAISQRGLGDNIPYVLDLASQTVSQVPEVPQGEYC